MPLVNLDNISLAFGLEKLLDDASLQIDKGERIAIIGRNGAGKSSLLQLVTGAQKPDSGKVWRQANLKIAMLGQELPEPNQTTVYQAVASGLIKMGALLNEHHQLLVKMAEHYDESLNNRLQQLHHEIDAIDGWKFEQHIKKTIQQLNLPADEILANLSGGWLRRVALAQALVKQPDLLILDEPTNHMDVDAITWLEKQLLAFSGAILFVTHDRTFLTRVATRIIDLDRGILKSWPGNYQKYLQLKQHSLEVEQQQAAEFDKKLSQEERWIRQGVKARRTRNEGRVRALQELRKQRSQRREQQAKASMHAAETQASGKIVIDAKNISFTYQDKPLISKFSTRIQRGDKVGIVGANGSGKSTLVQLLLKQLATETGKVKHGTNLEFAYFDQHRSQLDLEDTVFNNIAEGREYVELPGKKKHVMGYLQDFLFTPQRARTPVKALSGGERNRLLLARLFSKTFNVLVLDEPTNDLDIETLELLEELLIDYKGTLLLVTHDRAFIDNIVTSCIVFEQNGQVSEFVGGYSDWQHLINQKTNDVAASQNTSKKATKRPSSTKKLSYNEQRELQQLPKTIEKLESQQVELQNQVNAPDFYQQDKKTIADVLSQLADLELSLTVAFERWDELEQQRSSYEKGGD